MKFLILPDQLFDIKHFDKSFDYVLWECPHYFQDYKYNKKKLMLHRASMKCFYDKLSKNKYNVKYFEFSNELPQDDTYILYRPLNKIKLLNLPKNHTLFNKQSPALLLSEQNFAEYHLKTKKFFFNAFYMWSKKQLDIIPNIKSKDKENRLRIPNTLNTIKQPFETNKINHRQYIDEAASYVNKHFANNYGNTNDFLYPISHDDAYQWLVHFIKFKFTNFGPYQDFIDKNNCFLYHSLLSTLINIGLITPMQVIHKITKYENKIPLNSYEGFIRQLFWREYQYYCYVYYDFSKKNYFGNKQKLTLQWYNATTGIQPLDDAIKDAFNTGYLHHIRRLMIVGNYMNLNEVHPREGFKWFMEFSCDSYEWVMHQNVLDMVFFVSGGETMRRPYISSSNYILKMSNYDKGTWSQIWDAKYRHFINKNKTKLWRFRYYVRL